MLNPDPQTTGCTLVSRALSQMQLGSLGLKGMGLTALAESRLFKFSALCLDLYNLSYKDIGIK